MVRSSRAQSRGVESQVSAAKGGGRFAKLPSFAPKYEMARRSKTLHMSMLSLTAVPSEVWNIAGLVRLDLGHNELPRLPPKRLTYFGGAPSELQIEERRLRLEEYLQQLVRQLNWSRDEALRAFLECDGWLKPRKPKAKKEPGASAAAAAGGAPGSP